mmetsp:Transcript_25138/g.38153  ORF Transcript_25138/g.38153 Transcript_25138/m.38153 type:complete len:100 (-) Transcript_25138:374-673(-)|eukprot:CAMPEP_0178932996 /NCGR_PEP_ID=MMETSP0786-20121207/22980_1 /TAXON_ID=186022 /ORGANISM="Thalassionema frauenfeldii, Strain CCMP 1798" /LENGTH=99 /DNA_ID=CAMNT_0020610455 /DNA_START=122 /DNA_END=421 /DNA_ORIENTATION=-
MTFTASLVCLRMPFQPLMALRGMGNPNTFNASERYSSTDGTVIQLTPAATRIKNEYNPSEDGNDQWDHSIKAASTSGKKLATATQALERDNTKAWWCGT